VLMMLAASMVAIGIAWAILEIVFTHMH
jgi:hypothetical protein